MKKPSTETREPTQQEVRRKAVEIRCGELVEVHLRTVSRHLTELNRLGATRGGPVVQLTEDQQMAVRVQFTTLLVEIATKATSLEPNGRQITEARKSLGIDEETN